MDSAVGSSRLLPTIRRQAASLSEASQRVADFVLAQPEAARYLSISELARRCGVSETTVVRFCRSIGYAGYREFARSLADSLTAQAIRVGALPQSDEWETKPEAERVVRGVFQTHQDALGETLKLMDFGAVQRAADAIAGAGQVHLYAVGSPGSVAAEAAYRMLRHGIPATAIVDTLFQLSQACLLRRGDVALGISQSGRMRDVLDAIELAKEAGATTIGLTGVPDSPLAHLCDITLWTLAAEDGFQSASVSARFSELAILDALTVVATRHQDDDAGPGRLRLARAMEKKRVPWPARRRR